jgi:hypothetical protein
MSDSVELMSLREACEVVEDAKVSDVKLLFENPQNERKVILVVEGPDDVDVYGRLMDSNVVCIYPDCNCDKHEVILRALNGKYGSRLLAIKDADFDRLEGRIYQFSNLFLTDTHDLETMIAEDCLMALTGDDKERCSGINLLEIYAELEDISYLKWYNQHYHTCIDFSTVLPTLDFESYFNSAVAATSYTVSVALADVAAFKAQHSDAPVKDVCNGHDLFERIYVRAKAAKRANYQKKQFFKRMRAAYPKISFANTTLFQHIKSWESANKRTILAV